MRRGSWFPPGEPTTPAATLTGPIGAVSSGVEHFLDAEGVRRSNRLPPTRKAQVNCGLCVVASRAVRGQSAKSPRKVRASIRERRFEESVEAFVGAGEQVPVDAQSCRHLRVSELL